MVTFEAWDIIKVPFPYIDRSVRQHRPALVVSASERFLWVLMVTSAENRGWPGDVDIGDSPGTGLPVASIVRTAKIATIEVRDAERLGSLAGPVRSQVAGHLRVALQAALDERADP